MNDLLALLQEFYRDKQGELLRHEAGARVVVPYDFNNTYQYIINREEVQLSWLAAAIGELGGRVPAEVKGAPRDLSGKTEPSWRRVVQEDQRAASAFAERWRTRVEAMGNARHRGMLLVILGETLEQRRFFEQALANCTDLLGRRGRQAGPAVGEVLPTRWID